MKFTINPQLLRSELEAVMRVIKSNSPIPVLSNVCIDATGGHITFIGTNLEQTISAPVTVIGADRKHTVEREGGVLVNAKALSDYTKTLKNDILFDANDDKLTLTCGPINVEMPTCPVDQFPEMPTLKTTIHLTMDGDDLRTMVKDTSFATTTELSRFTLAGGKFESDSDGTRLITTDGNRLAYTSIALKGDLDAIIPAKALLDAAKLANGSISIASDDNFIKFETGGRTLITRKLTGIFPNYQIVMPQNNDKLVSFDVATMKDAVKRAMATVDKHHNSLHFTFRGNGAVIENWNDDCKRSEIVPVDYASEEITTVLNGKYLADFLSNVSSGKGILSMKDANTPVQFTLEDYDHDYRYVLCL